MPDTDENSYRRLARAARLPYVALDAVEGSDPVQFGAATLIPAELARRHRLIPISATPDEITVASSEPGREAAVTAVRALTGRDVRFVVSTPDQIARAHARVFGLRPAIRGGRFVPAHAPPASERDFPRRLAARGGLDYSELADLEREVDVDTAHLLGERFSRRFVLLALTAAGGEIRIATAQPHDAFMLALVEAATALRPVQVVAPADRIAAGIEYAFGRAARTQPLGPPDPRLREADPHRRLGELLIAARVLDRASLASALAIQRRNGEPLGRILLALGWVSQDRLASVVAEQLRVPHVRDADLRPTRDAADLLPETVCRTNRILPLELVEGTLVVAMVDPLDETASRELRAASRWPTRVVVASETSIVAGLELLFADRLVEISTTDLLRRNPDESAHEVLAPRQKLVLLVGLLVIGISLVVATIGTLIVLTLLSIAFYSAIAVYKFLLVYRTAGHAPELPVSDEEVALLEERSLPHYTILVPLYHEAVMTTQLISALDHLDYPKTKLDVKLLLEEDDRETIAAVRSIPLGPQFHVVVLPDSQPKTKPKACNYGLLHARGKYVVIFDAEDAPEPDQLKKAVIAFRKAPPGVVCVQAKLNYWNRDQNLLTRWFTTEYSMWFDLFLPGLDATGAPIPLGGTSNHFAVETLLELGAWDPFNVTEDADVGIRLARKGYRTTMIESTTYEEANSRVYNWIRQRSRWVKGYIQTWLVHMRHPVQLWQELGPANFLSFQLVVGGTFMTMLLNPLYWALTSLWALTEAGLIRHMFPGPVYFAAAFNLFIGNFVFTYLNVLGAIRRGYFDLVRYALFSPLYWALMSVGAWKGFLQLLTRPSYWEKTVHGLTR